MMTVEQLIAELSQYPLETEVMVDYCEGGRDYPTVVKMIDVWHHDWRTYQGKYDTYPSNDKKEAPPDKRVLLIGWR